MKKIMIPVIIIRILFWQWPKWFLSIEREGDMISCDIHGCRTAMGRLVERFGTPPPRTRSWSNPLPNPDPHHGFSSDLLQWTTRKQSSFPTIREANRINRWCYCRIIWSYGCRSVGQLIKTLENAPQLSLHNMELQWVSLLLIKSRVAVDFLSGSE